MKDKTLILVKTKLDGWQYVEKWLVPLDWCRNKDGVFVRVMVDEKEDNSYEK